MQTTDVTDNAIDYGQLKECLHDHRALPFCFSSCVLHFHDTIQETGLDGLVPQSGLRAGSLPFAQVASESLSLDFVQHQPPELDFTVHLADLTGKHTSLLPVSCLPQSLLNSEELLDLGSVHQSDVEEYFQAITEKLNCHPSEHWLPLAPVRVDRDEGLSFPPNSDRLQLLLQREVDRESLDYSERNLQLAQEVTSLQSIISGEIWSKRHDKPAIVRSIQLRTHPTHMYVSD